MNRIISTSIQRQLQLFFVLTLGITVLIMGGVWISHNQVLLEEEAERVLIVQSDIIGAAARPALMFNDQRMAGELLQAMKFDPDVSVVKLFTYDGNELFTYTAEGDTAGVNQSIEFQSVPGSAYTDGRLKLFRVIEHKGSPVGVIYLESDMNHLKKSKNAGFITVIMVMVGCLVFGLLLASRLQARIASPISSLAGLMRKMGTHQDYMIRADQPVYNRETQDLLQGFNQMAEKIQQSFDTIEQNHVRLKESEERFRNIVELAPVPVIVTRPSDGHVLFYNQASARLIGVNEQGQMQLNAVDFYRHPEDRDVILEKLKKQGEFHGHELEVVGSDGESLWISLSMSMMFFEGEQVLFSAFVDITEQKSVERVLAQNNQALEQRVVERTSELQSARDELQSTLDNMIDTYYRVHADGTVNWVSASVEALLGYQASEIAGMPLESLSVDGLRFPQVTEALEQHGGAVINQRVQLKHKQGYAIWVSISAHRIDNKPGELSGVEGVVRDITLMVQAEEQKRNMEEQMAHVQRLESLGVLAGGIAHDFNNILAGIMGNAELAEINALEGESVDHELKNILTGSNRAADLCRQMLAYSGQGIFLRSEVNMTMLIEEALQLIDVSISKNISLKLDLSNALPNVNADKTQMQQIIMNLVTNAAESIGDETPGNITITTSLIQAGKSDLQSKFIDEIREPGSYVLFEVVDNGCGMNKETMDKMFDPFFTTKFTGRGLGMSAVLGIVRSHEGVIQVSSKPGRGTRFKVLLPVSNGEMIDLMDEDVEITPYRDSERTILLIDDEVMVRTVVDRLMKKLGCKVMLASDGVEGFEIYKQHRAEIDLVLLDMTMPKMGGKETLSRLRDLNATLPVIICSGYSNDTVSGQFDTVQPSGFLQKPFSLKLLREVLDMISTKS
ncbi:two-component system, NtrC family, sensor histidine kinase AtoS [Mariprofundus micogutta]|uniref:histidine kinase n=1 Tax=Mariprofundus micogutta TaxID=1921010 RepID=A0A1L8CQA8_9PROT|nr:PAS domain S-box protein [Mariprofundus micogutta]GAV21077.1 two-component system, NtrC family, sensor histidine kinase AtoS [Mariprofundus micogutta]